jgi:hypothetical protein
VTGRSRVLRGALWRKPERPHRSISTGRWWNGPRYQLKLANCWTFLENSISTGVIHGVEIPS